VRARLRRAVEVLEATRFGLAEALWMALSGLWVGLPGTWWIRLAWGGLLVLRVAVGLQRAHRALQWQSELEEMRVKMDRELRERLKPSKPTQPVGRA